MLCHNECFPTTEEIFTAVHWPTPTACSWHFNSRYRTVRHCLLSLLSQRPLLSSHFRIPQFVRLFFFFFKSYITVLTSLLYPAVSCHSTKHCCDNQVSLDITWYHVVSADGHLLISRDVVWCALTDIMWYHVVSSDVPLLISRDITSCRLQDLLSFIQVCF